MTSRRKHIIDLLITIKNELKFEDVQGMTILKPYYDYECFSLIQPIHTLLDNKEAAWIQHSDIDN